MLRASVLLSPSVTPCLFDVAKLNVIVAPSVSAVKAPYDASTLTKPVPLPPRIRSPFVVEVVTLPVPLGVRFKSILVSPPVAEIIGPPPVAALVTVTSLTALATKEVLMISLALVSSASTASTERSLSAMRLL